MQYQSGRKIVGNYSYSYSDKIGAGYSSQVFKGRNEKINQNVAIKIISKKQESSQKVGMADVEIYFLEQLKCSRHILELKSAIQTKNNAYIVTELCERGTIRQLLQIQGPFGEAKALQFLRQIITAYKSIHAHRIIHRDIKPENIFVNRLNQIKIGDFGFAISSLKCINRLKDNVGSPLFMPYESLTRNEYSFKSDIWSIGVTFIEMLTGRAPWKSKTQRNLIDQLESLSPESVIPSGLSSQSLAFLSRVLVKSVKERLSPEELFQFSFHDFPVSYIKSVSDKLAPRNKKSNSLHLTFSQNPQTPPHENLPISSIEGISAQKGFFLKASVEVNQELNPPPKLGKECNKRTLEGQVNESEKSTQQDIVPGSISHCQLHQKISNSLVISAPLRKQQQNQKSLPTNAKSPLKHIGSANHRNINVDSSIEMPKSKPILPQTIQQSIPLEEIYSAQLEKQILLIIKSQINYFRFLFKLSKKMQETLQTTDPKIKQFKQNILFILFEKIEEINALKYLPQSPQVTQLFRSSPEYANLINVLAQYKQRYLNYQKKIMLNPVSCSDIEFLKLNSYVSMILYQNLLRLENKNEEFFRKKELLTILDSLIELNKLYNLQLKCDWKAFHLTSSIGRILQKNSENDAMKQWQRLKDEIQII